MSTENKTKPTSADVKAFIDSVAEGQKREDAYHLLEIMRQETGEDAVMWGPSIIGFGQYHYKYESGREGDMCRVGFSPRKANIVLYLIDGRSPEEEKERLLEGLGKFTASKGCIYVKKLADIDETALRKLIKQSYDASAE